ncbi:restriction endonuclease subunit S [Gordonibacter massiliensis]|nr:restriction endonuclease subunit S [Gordonibacter massiliensis (ex Traore et al. 2017)]
MNKSGQFSEYELGAICSRLSSGKGIRSEDVSSSGYYPVYGGNGLRGYTNKSNFRGECVVVGRQGAFCGNVRYFQGEAYMTEHAVVVCADERHSTRYLSYLLSTMSLGQLSGQSAQPGLSVKALSKQIVALPDLGFQNRAVAVLSALDDKIALNNRINDYLAA